MGDITLAANAILLHFLTMMAYGLDGFAHAAEILTGGALGARSRAAFLGAVRSATIWGSGCAVVVALAYAALGPQIHGLVHCYCGGADHGGDVPTVDRAVSAGLGVGFPAGRDLHWDDPVRGHAQRHGGLRARLSERLLVTGAGTREPRPVGSPSPCSWPPGRSPWRSPFRGCCVLSDQPASGIRITTVRPPASRFSAWISPPIACRLRRTIHNPMPKWASPASASALEAVTLPSLPLWPRET